MEEEGFRAKAYVDTNGHQTIGYGFNIDAGISRLAAERLARAQAEELDASLTAFPWYAALDYVRQSAVLDMAFNLGMGGLLRFPNMIAALTRKDWAAAAKECHVKDPKLAKRYERLAYILEHGTTIGPDRMPIT